MNQEKKHKIKKFITLAASVTGVAYGIMSILARKKKKSSVYEDDLYETNPFEGKKVVFVENDSDRENADGVKGHLEAIGDSDYMPGFYDRYVKRWFDVVISFFGLLILSPVFAIVAIAIKVEDPGPVLFTQKRVGQNKKYFKLHKFRSMKMSTPHDVPTHMLDNPDQYITKVGKFIRAHSLDELPQIWDIFIGNMSIIGPRPALWNQDVLIAERDKYGANDIKPGLTGWAQINGRDELEIPQKAKLDGEYMQKESLFFDIRCFLGTVSKVGRDDSVVEGGTGEMKKENDKINKKKILVICQYYKPEPFRISDLCEELVRKGHEVHVVTGYPNYPEGILYQGYGRGKHIDEEMNGVRVHRCFTVPRETGTLKRVMNYYSFVLSSVKYVLSKKCVTSKGKAFDYVFCNQLSPVMMSYAAIAYKRKYKIPCVMYCLDLWPESLVAGGVKRTSIIYKYYRFVSRRIYKEMDRILVTSRMFIDYLSQEFDINKEKIELLPQYAENLFEKIEEKKENDYFDFMFAGNIGEIQSVETIINAARLLKNEPVRFHIVGSGSDLDRIKQKADGLHNVIFYGRHALEEMPKFYEKADAMLITLKADPFLSMTLPGKIQSYMAVGKPIIGAIDGETRKTIEIAKCGLCGAAENVEELVKNIKLFIDTNTNRAQMGINSRKYYENYFSKQLFMDKLDNYFI